MEVQMATLLLYGGAALMAAAALSGLIAGIALRITGKRLKAELERDYGKRGR